MSVVTPECGSALSLGKEDNLRQQVLASFPLCDLTEEDLTQNPQFCKMLATLSQHVDNTGLTVSLKTQLEKAEQQLQNQRRRWLQSESLHRALQEMIEGHYVRKHQATSSDPAQDMFCDTMEQCLLVSQCVRQLDPSANTSQDQPSELGLTRQNQTSLLGLTPQDVTELMPSEKNVQRMKRSLPRQLEKHLKEKCFSLLSYCQPDWESESEGLKKVKLSYLSGQLDNEKKKAESLKDTCRENCVLLQSSTSLS